MAAIRSAAISAAALVALRGFSVRRLAPCLAASPRAATSAAGKMLPRSAMQASAFTTVVPDSDEAVDEPSVEADTETELSKLACPICYYPLVSSIDHHSAPTKSDSSLECSTCKKVYPSKDDYWDLAVAVGSNEYSESMPAATELFRTPLVSFLYERGWRQNFIWGGFPGLEREFDMAKTYLKPTTGGVIVDASCGSGLFSRLFIKSGLYSLVVALNFSESMLKQCNEFIKQENISDERLAFVRADISRLPLVAEISRVLRPGGIFVASTFIADVLPPAVPVLWIGRPYIGQITGSNIFLSEAELEDLCTAYGLIDFTFVRNGFYIMFSATKAS
ncbi:uncharacterized methyltransferase At1g78140, chloroplastic-like isoform X1 [Lolium rigidum]|uniref:uncharacterized methyltransferase At1g78140, chloroplastic-like isoform X1 n=1 Tax=Lolium rigidum TaxID=89674 RepID=UPI001F5DB685|nr:uncharacterized methyltransferase At1g78140, chloroplastic-like isoform X1 [Lolium rigidum]